MGDDIAEEASIDEEEMLKYVVKAAKKDGFDLTEDEFSLFWMVNMSTGNRWGFILTKSKK